MNGSSTDYAPDLVVHTCPLGCNGKCARIWKNQITGHRIICECTCEHKKMALGFEKPVANAMRDNTSCHHVRTVLDGDVYHE